MWLNLNFAKLMIQNSNTMMPEKEKLLAGLPSDANYDSDLIAERLECKEKGA